MPEWTPAGVGVPEWTPAGVWILGWSRSRSQYFRFEPEQEPKSTLRSVEEPIKIFKGPIKISEHSEVNLQMKRACLCTQRSGQI